MHTEARLLASNILSKFGIFWDQIATEVEAFRLGLVTNTYGEAVLSSWIAYCWTVVLTTMRYILVRSP